MTPEAKVKTKIVAHLKYLRDVVKTPIYWFSPIGSVFGQAGVPDIIVCWDGKFVGIEVKALGKIKNTTPLQKIAHRNIADARGHILVADNVEMIKDFFGERIHG